MKNDFTIQKKAQKSERVVVYVDGFNLYFGMKEAKLDYYKWLNIRKLIDKLLQTHQILLEIKYFTSRVNNNPDKQKRQSTYIEALEGVGIKIIYGKYQDNYEECNRCGHSWKLAKEKMTDVNIATEMVIDAFGDKYDMAMLISGDSDLVPPIKAIHTNFPSKRVLVAFPPKRHNVSLTLVAKGNLIIGKNNILKSQFEEQVLSKNGFKLHIPETWK